jgi:hypothetical protein
VEPYRSLRRELHAAQGRSRPQDTTSCYCTVLGMRLTTPSGHSFAHPDMPPIVVSMFAPDYVAATERQKQEILKLWLSTPDAPPKFRWPAIRLPTLADGIVEEAIDPQPTSTTQETTIDE